MSVLIDTATTWFEGDDACYAQIHAWRALAQLGAVDAVQPLLDFQEELDEAGDDWYLEDFHHVFGMIGPAALERLATFLGDTTRGDFPRRKAVEGMVEIAKQFPETRERVVNVLSAERDRHDKDQTETNGSLVSDLMDLNATESAESIERAFAANVVDPMIAGDWGDVRKCMGVEGLGLAPDNTPGWPTLAERMGITGRIRPRMAVDPEVAAEKERRKQLQLQRKLRESKQRARAKRKRTEEESQTKPEASIVTGREFSHKDSPSLLRRACDRTRIAWLMVSEPPVAGQKSRTDADYEIQRMKKPRKSPGLEEARAGFEPAHDGFAIRCLSHLATAPMSQPGTQLPCYSLQKGALW